MAAFFIVGAAEGAANNSSSIITTIIYPHRQKFCTQKNSPFIFRAFFTIERGLPINVVAMHGARKIPKLSPRKRTAIYCYVYTVLFLHCKFSAELLLLFAKSEGAKHLKTKPLVARCFAKACGQAPLDMTEKKVVMTRLFGEVGTSAIWLISRRNDAHSMSKGTHSVQNGTHSWSNRTHSRRKGTHSRSNESHSMQNDGHSRWNGMYS